MKRIGIIYQYHLDEPLNDRKPSRHYTGFCELGRLAERDAWLVPAKNIAENILRAQWPERKRVAEAWPFEQLLAAVNGLPAFEPLSMEEIARRMEAAARNYETFAAALKGKKP